MKVSWSDLNDVHEAGRYPFRDGFITVLETELAVWRSHPMALFSLYTKYPIRDQVEYVLGKPELKNQNRDQIKSFTVLMSYGNKLANTDGRDEEFYYQAEQDLRESSLVH